MNCDFLWTGGFAVVSGSNDNWNWNMSTHTKPAQYLPWGNGEPNNYRGMKEDAILVDVKVMKFIDIRPDVQKVSWTHNKIFCYMCEYTN